MTGWGAAAALFALGWFQTFAYGRKESPKTPGWLAALVCLGWPLIVLAAVAMLLAGLGARARR